MNAGIYKALLLIALFLVPVAVLAEEPASGEKLFKTNCKACHNLNQPLVGPALKGINTRRDSAWIYQFVKGSQAMIEAGDATAVTLFNQYNQVIMPNQTVTDDELGRILAYIESAGATKADANPIQRPVVEQWPLVKPMKFTDFFFWMPFTIGVLALIFMLYAMTILYDASRETKVNE